MSDEAAFLAAIAADPGDDTARVAFADWLDDRDDFRGPFVRAGVAFDRTPPYDPARFRLAARLRELLETHSFKEWLPAHPALRWDWRRGLLGVTVDTALLEDRGLSAELAGRLASDWVERAAFDDYTRAAVSDREYTFHLVRSARELHFGIDSGGPDSLAWLRAWPHLRRLRMSYPEQPWAALAALPHLRAVALRSPGRAMMSELPGARLPNLEGLHIDREWYGDLPGWGTCFPSLRSLTLTHWNGYPDEQCERFAACPHLRHLALYQRYRPFTRTALQILATMTQLRSLSLGPAPRGTIEGLSALPHLERLGVEGKAAPIRGLEALTGLRWLSINRDKLTKAVAGQVRTLPRLARLDLRCDAFEGGAVSALARAEALQVLIIDARGKPPSVAELSRSKGLQYLRVTTAGFEAADFDALRVALPGCLIAHGTWPAADDRHDESDWG